MGSSGHPGGTGGSSAGRGDKEKSDRRLNLLETKIIRTELRRKKKKTLEDQTGRNQLDTTKRIQKQLFSHGDHILLSSTGGG